MTDTQNATLTELEHLDLAASVAGMQPIEVVLPNHLSVTSNGLRFHLVDWGKPAPDKPTILFLHGVGLTARTWDLVCLGLRQDFHCLALDQRGHGDSDWAPDGEYGTDALTADVNGLVKELGLDQFFLVGHSMGGMVALSYGVGSSATLRGLVLVDSAPGERNPPPVSAMPPPNNVFNFMAGPAELDSVEDFVERAVAFNPARDRRLLRRSLLHNLRQQPDGRWTWKYDRGHILGRDRSKMAASRRALWDALPSVTVPTLVVRGARSESLSNALAAEFASSLPDGRWEIVADAGHTIQGDNPRGLLEAVSPFFDEVMLASA